ncbi:MAG TPA: hypothetical protein VM553_13150, partial [Dongiaceae bacterium]|nr:hypothetical protein [Dongiaceae bacterium]
PASVINPISTINSAYSTCILYKPDASNAIYCMGLREPTPTFNNPTALWGEDEDTYCATDSSGTQCWGKYPPLPG